MGYLDPSFQKQGLAGPVACLSPQLTWVLLALQMATWWPRL